MIYDRKIYLSIGASRRSTNRQGEEVNYSDFVVILRTPRRSEESLEAYLKLPKGKQEELKDVGGFVAGRLKGTRRKADAVISRDLVTLDFDSIKPYGTEEVLKTVRDLGVGFTVYSTRKHRQEAPRLRLIFPLDRAVPADEYEPIGRVLAEKVGIEMADPTTFEPSRLMYRPSCSKDSDYVFECEDRPFVKADEILNSLTNWRDISCRPVVPGAEVRQKRLITKAEDPRTKRGLIGAFCRVYDVFSAIDTYLPKAYEKVAKNRLTFTGGTTAGGAIVYEDGLFLYSHHATDPCSGILVNARDLVRLHKFGDLDDKANPDTPVTSLPSTKAMQDLAGRDKAVMGLLAQERQEAAKDYFEAIEGPKDEEKEAVADDSRMNLLTLTKSGSCQSTIANIVLILDNDPDFKGKIYTDVFANRGMVELPLPWEDGEGSRYWTDVDDAQLALRLEKDYGITGRDKIDNALTVVGFNHKRNEVVDYFDSLEWDGVERIKTLLSDYLGADQSTYTEEVMRKSLVAACARAVSSKGVKFDNMPVLVGPQGIGKSTFLAKLGKERFSDSLYSFEGKEAAELIQGTLINEVGELSALTKSETETVKQFLSKTHDIYREAYGRKTNKYPRRCVFFGTTNSNDFLKDSTGSRRFWPVECGEYPTKKDIFKDLDKEVDQIRAEAYLAFILGEPLVLSEEAKETALENQENYRDEDPREGIISEFLNRKIPKNRYKLSVRDQRSFMNDTFEGVDEEDLVEREKVCIAEIWQVCLGGDIKYLKRQDSYAISNIMNSLNGRQKNKSLRRYGVYGTQRGYERCKIINFNEIKSEN